MEATNRFLGPRVPKGTRGRREFKLPTIFFVSAAVLLLASILLPYWRLNLAAPQFPKGLIVDIYVNDMTGDVELLEGLNHYVGLPGFDEGATLERQIAIAGILAIVGTLAAGLFIHSKWIVLFTLPALTFPLVFLADLQYWLWHYGHSLDPLAPFASAVGEFTPPVLGPSKIAQFDTMALPHVGLLMAFAATALVILGLRAHRKVYEPIVKAADGAAVD
jgi:hypothetical protein